jgi:SPP1 family predicted phage head-tail adaptor
MNQPVTFFSKSVTRDALGGEVITWVDEGDDWAEVAPLRGREYFVAQQIDAEAEIRFRVRYRPDVDETWRLEWRSVQYDIVAPPVDVDARQRTTELMCRTVPHV